MRNNSMAPGSADILVVTPDGRRKIVLEWLDEIHFGPPYYALWIQLEANNPANYYGPGRDIYYGASCALSPEGRFLVVERWLSLEKQDTCVMVLDLLDGREVRAIHVGAGFVREVKCLYKDDGSIIECVVDLDVFDGSGWRARREVFDICKLKEWKPLEWWPTPG